MSTQTGDASPRYFRCDDFAITMPVAECKDRRRHAKLPGATSESAGERKSNRYMTKRCAECVLFRERTKPENTISHEQMMEHLNQNPSLEAAPNERRAIYYGSLRTPHKDYGTLR